MLRKKYTSTQKDFTRQLRRARTGKEDVEVNPHASSFFRVEAENPGIQ